MCGAEAITALSALLPGLSLSYGEWGPLFVVVCGLLIPVASLVADHWPRLASFPEVAVLGSLVVAPALN